MFTAHAQVNRYLRGAYGQKSDPAIRSRDPDFL